MRRFIIFLIRRRLGVKLYERFQFVNQKSDADYYWFTEIGIMKREFRPDKIIITKPSTVSLNWLLDNDCVVISYKDKEEGN